MDPLTRAFYEQQLKIALLERRGESFQDLFSAIMERRYPSGDFQRVRPWGSDGDRKNDGYLRSRRILFQCYAPDGLRASELVEKIHQDFSGAVSHWEAYFDTWVFVHNDARGIAPKVAQALLDITATHPPFQVEQWSYAELLAVLRELDEPALADLFGRAPTRGDVLALGLEDLFPVLDHLARLPPQDDPDLRPVPADKLARNLLSAAVAELLRMGMSRANLVPKYFRDRPTEQDKIADGFRTKYQTLRDEGRSPDDIFGELQRYAGWANAMPMRQVAVLAVLAFFFQTCDIFERPDPHTPEPKDGR